MNGRRLTFFLLLAFLLFAGCVEEPAAKDGGTLWDQYANEIKDTAPTGADDLLETPDTDDAPACMGMSCATHADCKIAACAATFCTTVLGALAPDNPNACAVRCDPVNNSSECPDGMTCNDKIPLVPQVDPSIDIDGAKGICEPSTRR